MFAWVIAILMVFLLPCQGGWADSPSFATSLTRAETDFMGGLLERLSEKNERIHMIEYGGHASTIEFSNHPAVESWSVIVHNHSLRVLYPPTSKVTAKSIGGDFSLWEKHQNPSQEEGTFAEYEDYISETVYFGARDTLAYWVTNFGKARADVAIAVLPLLSRTGGLMLVPDWDVTTCDGETYLNFYELVEAVEGLAILRPKGAPQLTDIFGSGNPVYDWCFSWLGGNKAVRRPSSPSDTGSIMAIVQNEIGCFDMFGDLHCENNDDGSSTCVSCYAALTSISKRGQWVRQGLRKIAKNQQEVAVENAMWTF